MNFTDVLVFLNSNIYLYFGAFILVLSILVFVHEWGHYIVARMCGVKVETFSIGFGKELFGFYDKRGTRWKISLVPLGGYVKLFGDVDPASVTHEEVVHSEHDPNWVRPMTADEKKVAFFAKPVAQRAAVVAAGPGINYLFAIVLMSVIFMWNGQPATPPSAAAVIAGSAAAKHGFQPHDVIISIDGRSINDFDDIRREMMIALDEERHFIIKRGGQEIEINARPEKQELTDRFGFKHSIGLLGLISPRHAIDVESITKVSGREYKGKDALLQALNKRLGTSFEIEVQRGPKFDKLLISPLKDFNKDLLTPLEGKPNVLYLSDGENNIFIKYPPLTAVKEAVRQTWLITLGTAQALGQIIMGTRSPTELGGVIRIGALAGDMAQQGLVAFIMFTALLSINLGLVNLFPIPMLDGGHLVFYAFEALLGRPIPDNIQEYAFRFGLVFLVCLMVFANLNDIMQLYLNVSG
jgi:regulator of sigma E protease